MWRRRILLAVGVGLMAGIVLGNLLLSSGPSCREWQAEYERVAEAGRGGAFAFINLGPTADKLRELRAERPDDCAIPD